jgi:hypothetical protein
VTLRSFWHLGKLVPKNANISTGASNLSVSQL